MHLMALTKLSQFCNPCRVVGKTRSCPITANTGIQRLRRNIHSTNHLLGSTIGYGCLVTVTCLVHSTGKSGDCSVVSDLMGAVPKRSATVVNRRDHGRRPPCARSDCSRVSRNDIFTSKCRLYLDTRDLQFHFRAQRMYRGRIASGFHPRSPQPSAPQLHFVL